MTDIETIRDVSDTAFWVAHYRAQENQRSAPLVVDPLAELLAGPRGAAITQNMPGGQSLAWGVIVRTKILDDLLLQLLPEGFDTVINLAAGLDTRPYRLPLPATLRWVEIDFPPLIAYKQEALRGHTPCCRLQSLPADLANSTERQALLRQIADHAQRILVISEGLLCYLPESEVRALASDLRALPAAHTWLADVMASDNLEKIGRAWSTHLKDAPMVFAVDDTADFFGSLGWHEVRWYNVLEQATRMGRAPWRNKLALLTARWFSAERHRAMLRSSGITHLQRA